MPGSLERDRRRRTVTRVPKGQAGTSRLGKIGRQQYTPTSLGGAARRGDQTTEETNVQRNPHAPRRPPARRTAPQGARAGRKPPKNLTKTGPRGMCAPHGPASQPKGKPGGASGPACRAAGGPAGGTPKARHRAVTAKPKPHKQAQETKDKPDQAATEGHTHQDQPQAKHTRHSTPGDRRSEPRPR